MQIQTLKLSCFEILSKYHGLKYSKASELEEKAYARLTGKRHYIQSPYVPYILICSTSLALLSYMRVFSRHGFRSMCMALLRVSLPSSH